MALAASAAIHSEFASDPDYRDILELFADALPERKRSLVDAFRDGNMRELGTLAHQLKGAGGGFGFPGLTAHAADLESACKTGSPDRIAAELDRLLAYLQRIAI
jgi:HPt (histidine-containing phosphotransfer) domain-containing protein